MSDTEIKSLIQRAADDQDSLTAAEQQKLGKHFMDAAKKTKIAEAKAEVQRLAHELFPKLDTDEVVTADRLTALFAERAKPSDGSKPKFIDDTTKLKFVELTRAWRAAGGSLDYQGENVRLGIGSIKSSIQKRRFVVLEPRKGIHTIVGQVTLPALTFVK